MRLVLPLSLFIVVVSANIVVYHRIFHPSLQSSKYLQRGTIFGDPPTLEASESLAHDVETLSNTLKDLGNLSNALYQVAMSSERAGLLVYSSVKVCHLQQANARETWIIHAMDDDVPFALDYFVSPASRDGTCPKAPSHQAFPDNIQNMNTTVLFDRPKIPPHPDLRVPPPLNAEGEAIQPVPQKNFVQKYWMYIAGFLLIMMVASPEEPEQARNGQRP